MAALDSPSSGQALALTLAVLAVGGFPYAVLGGLLALTRRLRGPCYVAAISMIFFGIDWLRSLETWSIPVGLIGHSQVSVPGVAQLAALGGVPLVSAFVASISASIVVWLEDTGASASRRAAPRILGGAMGALLALVTLGSPVARAVWLVHGSDEPSIDVVLVQPNITPAERWSAGVQRTNLRRLENLTDRAVELEAGAPGLVVWPEMSFTVPIERATELRVDLEQYADAIGVPILVGLARASSRGATHDYRNSAVWVAPGTGIVDTVDKRIAIPVVEAQATTGWSRWIARGLGGDIVDGPKVETSKDNGPIHGSGEFPVTLCFELIYPHFFEAQRSSDSWALVNLANDSWLASEFLGEIQVDYARLRAIEQRLYLLRAAHGGISAVIDPTGGEVRRLGFGEQGSIRVTIGLPARSRGIADLSLLGVLLLGSGCGAMTASTPWRRWHAS